MLRRRYDIAPKSPWESISAGGRKIPLTWRATYGASSARLIWTQDHPDGAPSGSSESRSRPGWPTSRSWSRLMRTDRRRGRAVLRPAAVLRRASRLSAQGPRPYTLARRHGLGPCQCCRLQGAPGAGRRACRAVLPSRGPVNAGLHLPLRHRLNKPPSRQCGRMPGRMPPGVPLVVERARGPPKRTGCATQGVASTPPTQWAISASR